jgi:hypothetical protein
MSKSINIKDVANLIERLANTYGFDYDTEFQKFIAEFMDNDTSDILMHFLNNQEEKRIKQEEKRIELEKKRARDAANALEL